MSRALSSSSLTVSTLLAGVVLFAGCREKSVTTYTITKEKEPVAAKPAADMAGMSLPGGDAPAAPGATWTAPSHWEKQAPNSVRLGSYKINGGKGESADFAITAFPGDVGGDLPNVNRWRQQIGLPPISAEEVASVLKPIAAPAGTFRFATFVNTAQPPIRVFAAMLKHEDRTWFFKLAGPDALVAAEEDNFLGLLKTVQFSAAGATAATAPMPMGGMPTDGALPAGHPPIGGGPAMTPSPAAAPATAASSANSLAWAAPDNWAAKALGAMRRGSFTVKSDAGGEADCSIIVLGAAANPLLDNVNRWRGQVGLAPIDAGQLAGETTAFEANGLKFSVVDLAGKQPGAGTPARIVGAIVYRGEEAWFFKLSGPDATVAAEKAAFLQFLHTVRPAN